MRFILGGKRKAASPRGRSGGCRLAERPFRASSPAILKFALVAALAHPDPTGEPPIACSAEPGDRVDGPHARRAYALIGSMSTPFPRVALFGRFQTAAVGESVRDIADFLAKRGIEVLLDENTAASIGSGPWQVADTERIGHQASLAIAVGGDGTMLGVARVLAPFGVPVVGINHGRLGFITDIALAGWRPALGTILDGQFESEERSLLTSRVVRAGEMVWQELSLNDVVVSRSSRSGMIELQVSVDGLYMYTQRGDGLIIATPTGSTAYSLSANGPILHPLLRGVVLVPVAPQTLSNRPICLPDGASVAVRVLEGREPRVACDMQVFTDLQPNDDIVIERAPFTTRFLHPPGYSYFATLRGKLNWGELPSSLSSAAGGGSDD